MKPTNSERFKTIWKTILIAIICAAVLLILSGLDSSSTIESTVEKTKALMPVTFRDINPGNYPVIISGMAEAIAERRNDILSPLSGKVESVNPALEIGSRVKKGDLLAILNKNILNLELKEAEYRLASARFNYLSEEKKAVEAETMEILRLWREETGELEGAEKLNFTGSMETAGGFSMTLSARDEEILQNAASEIRKDLLSLKGVKSVNDSFQRGDPLIKVVLKPEAAQLGITTADLAVQIGDTFGGIEVQRFPGQSGEVKIKVMNRKEQRDNIRDLLTARIQNSKGESYPLLTVAELIHGYAPASVNRRNGNIVINISADLNKKIVTPSEAFK